MRIASYLLVALNVIVWGWLTWIGVGLIHGVVAQHVHGYPTKGQAIYYIFIPLGVLALSLSGAALAMAGWRKFGEGMLITTLIFLPIYILPYTGGM